MEKSKKVNILSCIIFIGFVLSVALSLVRGICFNMGYPFNTFLGSPDIIFSDFTDVMGWIKDLNLYLEPNCFLNYFPFMYVLLYPFALIKSVNLSFLIFIGITVILYFLLNSKFLCCENLGKVHNLMNVFVISFLSYPFLLMMNRGNTDMLIFPIFAAFAWFLSKSSKNRKYDSLIAALFLSVLCALKPYFWVFVLLFFRNKRYKNAVLCIILPVLITVLSFFMFNGELLQQISTFIINLKVISYLYIKSTLPYGIGFSSNILGALKGLFVFLLGWSTTNEIALVYKLIVVILTLVTIFALWREKIFWKQLTLLSLYIYSVPFMVYDYKLLFFLIPIWYFVNSQDKSRFDFLYTVIFALLFIPKTLFIWDIFTDVNFISINMFINPILMLVFMGLILFEQNKLSVKDE